MKTLYKPCTVIIALLTLFSMGIASAYNDTIPPIIPSATANPDIIVANGNDTSILNVVAYDDLSGIASVTVDLSAIGGSANQSMQYNNGVWQYITNATNIGNFQLPVNVTDNAGNSNTSVSITLKTIAQNPSILIYTDKANYKTKDIQKLGLDITNIGDNRSVIVRIWLSGYIYYPLIDQKSTLPANYSYNNPEFRKFILPNIRNGTYTWIAQIIDSITGAVLSSDSAKWNFTSTYATIEDLSEIIQVTDIELK